MGFRAHRPIKLLQSLRGSGRLVVANGRTGSVSYQMDCYLDRQRETASGCLDADAGLLNVAFAAGKADLILADGRVSEVVLLERGADGAAEFQVSGPIPC